MTYKGEKIGEFVNTVIVPGLTYGWGPKGSNIIAFSALKSGKVVILDEQGGKLEIDGSKDAVLPAWSPDAKRLAWLQKDGRKKFQLYIAPVSGS
jgi:Tol biopolymer transport system component